VQLRDFPQIKSAMQSYRKKERLTLGRMSVKSQKGEPFQRERMSHSVTNRKIYSLALRVDPRAISTKGVYGCGAVIRHAIVHGCEVVVRCSRAHLCVIGGCGDRGGTALLCIQKTCEGTSGW
jgi:hypothetical protein